MAESEVRIAIFGGALRSGSFNSRLLTNAARIAVPLCDVHLPASDELPFYNQDYDPGTGGQAYPASVAEFRDQIMSADGLVIVSPEYNWSIPGVIKNAIDWCSRPPMDCPLTGKPVLLAGASLGPAGTGRAQLHLRQVLQSTRSLVMLNELQIPFAQTRFDADGRLDEELETRLRGLLTELVADSRLATASRWRDRYRVEIPMALIRGETQAEGEPG